MSLTKLVYMGRAVLAQQRDACRILYHIVRRIGGRALAKTGR
jgi:hypothetical protein